MGGVDIKDRIYRARTYRMCFVGQEAVDWLVKALRLDSREEAVLLGTSRSIPCISPRCHALAADRAAAFS